MPLSEKQIQQVKALLQTANINASLKEDAKDGSLTISLVNDDLPKKFNNLLASLANDGSEESLTIRTILLSANQLGQDYNSDGKGDTERKLSRDAVEKLFKGGNVFLDNNIVSATKALQERTKERSSFLKSTDEEDITPKYNLGLLEKLFEKAGASSLVSRFEDPIGWDNAAFTISMGENAKEVITRLHAAIEHEIPKNKAFKDAAKLFSPSRLDSTGTISLNATDVSPYIAGLYNHFKDFPNLNGFDPEEKKPGSVWDRAVELGKDGLSKITGDAPKKEIKQSGVATIRDITDAEVKQIEEIRALTGSTSADNAKHNEPAWKAAWQYLSDTDKLSPGIQSAVYSVVDAVQDNTALIKNPNPELSLRKTTFAENEINSIYLGLKELNALTANLQNSGKLSFLTVEDFKDGNNNKLDEMENRKLKAISDRFNSIKGITLGEKVGKDIIGGKNNFENPIADRVETLAELYKREVESQKVQLDGQSLDPVEKQRQIELLNRKADLFKQIATAADKGSNGFDLSNPGFLDNLFNSKGDKVEVTGKDKAIIADLDKRLEQIYRAPDINKVKALIEDINQHYKLHNKGPKNDPDRYMITQTTPEQQAQSIGVALASNGAQTTSLEETSILPSGVAGSKTRSV